MSKPIQEAACDGGHLRPVIVAGVPAASTTLLSMRHALALSRR